VAELCVDANIAIKWFIKGEAFRQKALKLLRESVAAGITLIGKCTMPRTLHLLNYAVVNSGRRTKSFTMR